MEVTLNDQKHVFFDIVGYAKHGRDLQELTIENYYPCMERPLCNKVHTYVGKRTAHVVLCSLYITGFLSSHFSLLLMFLQNSTHNYLAGMFTTKSEQHLTPVLALLLHFLHELITSGLYLSAFATYYGISL